MVTTFSTYRWMKIPCLTAEQMREIDRIATEELHLSLIQMMELAGRHLATLSRKLFLGGDPRGKRIAVLAGPGGNGGGGLVAARRLANWGSEVSVWLSRSPSDMSGAPAHQLQALETIGAEIHAPDDELDLKYQDLLVDAIIGYSLHGSPTGHAAAMIEAANASTAPVLSLDLPSGLDATTAHLHEPVIRANATMTLALPKQGLLSVEARECTGKFFLADIAIPNEAYYRLGLDPGPVFAKDDLLQLV